MFFYSPDWQSKEFFLVLVDEFVSHLKLQIITIIILEFVYCNLKVNLCQLLNHYSVDFLSSLFVCWGARCHHQLYWAPVNFVWLYYRHRGEKDKTHQNSLIPPSSQWQCGELNQTHKNRLRAHLEDHLSFLSVLQRTLFYRGGGGCVPWWT